MIDASDAFGQGADRCVIGDVEGLCGDAGIIVGRGKPVLIAPDHNDFTALGPRQDSDSTRDAAAAPDDQNSAAPQRITHVNTPSPWRRS